MRNIVTPKPAWLQNAASECAERAIPGPCIRRVLARFVASATSDAIVELLTDLNERSDDLELEARRWGGSQG